MLYCDTVKAIDDGCDLPRSGLFRGEECEIVKEEGDNVFIKLPRSLDPQDVYKVNRSHIHDKKPTS